MSSEQRRVLLLVDTSPRHQDAATNPKPLTRTATIDLRVRPVDVPADWLLHVSPVSATLRPGEQITATVSIAPGKAAVQGTAPRVAVEGYVDDSLLGGAVIDLFLPRREAYDGMYRAFLPFVQH